ncbi:MAG: histidine kinase [Deltaproteobacteria bacterium]|nr:histidine kinase [Deltaproteobacteria bacterium]
MSNLKGIISSLAITAVFNTAIALLLNFMVLKEPQLFETFVISQLTGLSICLFVHIGMIISDEKINKWMGGCIALGLITGVIVGGLLSWGFLSVFFGVDLGYYYRHVFLYIAVFGIVFGVPITYFFSSREKLIESEKRIQNEKIKRLTMEKEAAMITLRLLQAQIEPHFLFNTLSNVISLFDIDVAKAKQMLIDVNEYLRVSLARTRQEMVTLSQELDLVRQYLDIFKIRMGKRLSYEINDQTGRHDLIFPPLIVQPLVENAIKYGLEPKIGGGKISINCEIEKEMLNIVISDTGMGLYENANQAGIGINNVSQRLESIYGTKAGLTLTQNYPSGVKAIIKVPL